MGEPKELSEDEVRELVDNLDVIIDTGDEFEIARARYFKSRILENIKNGFDIYGDDEAVLWVKENLG